MDFLWFSVTGNICKKLIFFKFHFFYFLVLKPSIDLICDPDYINLKLLSYIEYREKLSEDTRIKYTYAATYEDFVKMIDNYEDIELLKQMRWVKKG